MRWSRLARRNVLAWWVSWWGVGMGCVVKEGWEKRSLGVGGREWGMFQR
jgi:hypothetical protein